MRSTRNDGITPAIRNQAEFFNSIQTFRTRIMALISLGVWCAKDRCESQARFRPFATGRHETKEPGSQEFDPG
jgi:hypothetical protein